MINFVKPVTANYSKVWDSFIEPVAKYLDSFIISEKTLDGYTNVHMDMQSSYLQSTGLKGMNVLLPHGIADKNLRNANQVYMFDKVIVSGIAWREKLIKQGLAANKIFVGGYPKLDLIQKPLRSETKNVLWAPTHSLSAGSTYPKLLEFISSLEYNVAVSLHPYDRENKIPTFEELTKARVVIADAGSTVYEALALGIPVVFADWISKELVCRYVPGSFEAKIFEKGIGYHARTKREMLAMIKLAFAAKELDPRTQKFINRIIPAKFVGHSGKIIAEYLKTLGWRE